MHDFSIENHSVRYLGVVRVNHYLKSSDLWTTLFAMTEDELHMRFVKDSCCCRESRMTLCIHISAGAFTLLNTLVNILSYMYYNY